MDYRAAAVAPRVGCVAGCGKRVRRPIRMRGMPSAPILHPIHFSSRPRASPHRGYASRNTAGRTAAARTIRYQLRVQTGGRRSAGDRDTGLTRSDGDTRMGVRRGRAGVHTGRTSRRALLRTPHLLVRGGAGRTANARTSRRALRRSRERARDRTGCRHDLSLLQLSRHERKARTRFTRNDSWRHLRAMPRPRWWTCRQRRRNETRAVDA